MAASQIAYYRAIKDNPTLIAKALSDNPSLRSTYFSDNYRNLASKFDQNWYITSTTSNPSTTQCPPILHPALSPHSSRTLPLGKLALRALSTRAIQIQIIQA